MLFILLQLIMFAVAFYHVVFILFTKVEESFNMQAVHDLLFHVTNFSQYDHLEFPGVVPRTFIGPLVLAALSAPLRLFAYPYQMSKVHFQVTTRIAMAILVCIGHIKLAYSLQTALGNNAANWYMAITISQFHLMFYASRTLPNIFALIGFLFMMAYYMRREYYKAVVASAFTAVVFRLETSILFGLLFVPVLIENRRRGIKLVLHGSAFALIFLGLTVSIDSFFWNKLVWPEGSVWWYNVVLNKSHNWGVSPFLWYFYSALPRAMLASSLLIPFTLISSTSIRHMSICALVYIAIFSFLPHKELRFIFYAIALLNVCVAWVSAQILALRARFTLHTITAAFVLVHPLINILTSIFFIRAAMFNYPGGEAIMHMHTMLKADGLAMKRLQIHIDTYAAQTGVTRFLQSNPYWQYNKTEGLKPEDMWPFDYLLIGHEHNVSGLAEEYATTHRTIYQYNGFNGVLMRVLEEFPYFQVHYETRPQVALMKKVLIQGPSGTARVLET